jgi:hypothetical protein
VKVIDVQAVLGDFQANLGQLPCKYLGLLLHTGHITRDDEQTLIDKVAAKLPQWKEKLLNKA